LKRPNGITKKLKFKKGTLGGENSKLWKDQVRQKLRLEKEKRANGKQKGPIPVKGAERVDT
jgi:hypothetical protein